MTAEIEMDIQQAETVLKLVESEIKNVYSRMSAAVALGDMAAAKKQNEILRHLYVIERLFSVPLKGE